MTRLLRCSLAPALVASLLVAGALTLPLRPHGDAGEYLLMLESWRAHGSPDWRPHDEEHLRARLAAAAVTLDEDRYLPNYQRGRDGRLYCYHFWAYSLAGLPAHLALDGLGASPLRALPVTNAVLLGLALAGIAALPWTALHRVALGALLLVSPVLGFLMWPHPEIFSCALVTLALACWDRGRPAGAVLAAALASLQNPPLVLLVGGLALWAAIAALRRREVAVVPRLLAAALPALVAPAFFLWQFGVFNLSVRPSEASASLSLARALDLALDPELGLLPHAPVTLALGVFAAFAALARRRSFPAVLALVLLPALAFATTANGNWNNDSSGPSRYTVWLLPLLLFVAVGEAGRAPERPLARGAVVALGLALATQAWALGARGGPLARSDFLQHSPLARFVLDHAPALYTPAPEVFVERTLGREGPYAGPVIYRDRAGRCRKAWLQPRHAAALLTACGPPGRDAAVRLLAAAQVREAKRDWVYVNY